MIVRLVLLGLFTVFPGLVVAENIALKLKDGSIVKGELLSFVEGTYTLKSASLGLIEVESDKVGAIGSSADSVFDGDVVGNTHTNISDIITVLTQDKDIMSMIMALQNSPDVAAILADAEVMQAIQSMNYEALENHPKIKNLMRNAQINAIQKKIQ
jgi:hypothetical protein